MKYDRDGKIVMPGYHLILLLLWSRVRRQKRRDHECEAKLAVIGSPKKRKSAEATALVERTLV